MSKSNINVEYILGKLHAILEDEDVKTSDKLKAIRMCGEYLKMFEENKRVQIDIRGIIGQLTDSQLSKMLGGNGEKRYIDAEIVSQEHLDSSTPVSGHLLAGSNLLPSAGKHEEYRNDQPADADADRVEEGHRVDEVHVDAK